MKKIKYLDLLILEITTAKAMIWYVNVFKIYRLLVIINFAICARTILRLPKPRNPRINKKNWRRKATNNANKASFMAIADNV